MKDKNWIEYEARIREDERERVLDELGIDYNIHETDCGRVLTIKKPVEEPLLKINREFTDREKLNWVTKQYNELIKMYSEIKGENSNLKTKNRELLRRAKEDDLQYPSTMNGNPFVTVKAYMKLRGRYNALDKRFWEIVQELNKLKQEKKL